MAEPDRAAASGPHPEPRPERLTPERRADLQQRHAIARRLDQVEAAIVAARAEIERQHPTR